MPYGKSKATPEEVDNTVRKLCELYPNISKGDHRMITDITIDNYFSIEGIFIWYEETVSKLTPKNLAFIRDDPHTFFYKESHFFEYDEYVPLAQREEFFEERINRDKNIQDLLDAVHR